MSTIEEKLKEFTIPLIARRIIRELQDMKKKGIFCDDNAITITQNCEKSFNVILKNLKDNRLYKFTIPANYPFTPPRLELNNKPYLSYLKFQSEQFTNIFY